MSTAGSVEHDFDHIVIGSGFGGSVSACRLAEKGWRVGVMEMGRRWAAEDFPKSDWDGKRFIWRPGLRMFGFCNMRVFRHVVVMCGNAVGGGSIAYANALLVPSPRVWDPGSWAGLKDWKQVMPQHYATAERMLGVSDNQLLGEADFRLKKMADLAGVGNTLDKHYLYFAEKRGAQVFAETRVVDVRPLNGKPDGSDGYEVHTESSTALFDKQRRSFRCRGVVFAASSLGTVEMLFRLKQAGSLPSISDDLGKRVRTNAESLLGLRFPGANSYQNMLVCDGAMLSANLGMNPSLTITALTEHAMSHIPAKPALDINLPGSTMPQPQPSEAKLLAQPLHLPNGVVLRNRLAKSSMSEALGTYDNHATPRLVTLYRRWAATGIGLLLTGNVMIDRRALGEPGNVVIEDEADLPVLQQWARAATDQGAALWVQLNHPGKQSPKGLNVSNLSPSAVPFRQDMAAFFSTPREATNAEIKDIIQRFGRSAAICKKAGFSGVQIHGAHGYLISQFLSPHHNLRTDEWGGSPENRRRFVMAVYAEIRRQVGADFSVGIKLNSADFQRGGFTEEESLATIAALVEAGIDMIEISGGTYEAPAMSGAFQKPQKATTAAREAYFLDFAEKVRAAVQVPLMVTGGFRTVDGMNAALRSGALDIVGVSRLLAIDPDAPAALLQGRDSPQRVRPITTGIKPVDRMGLMEVLWYTRQLKRIAEGGNPRANESGLAAFLKSLVSSQWGTYQTKRLRA